MAQLRTISHQYNIETGRHCQNRESVVNRICTTCSKNDDDTVTLLAELPFFDPIVEDETYVIQTCPLYEDLRKFECLLYVFEVWCFLFVVLYFVVVIYLLSCPVILQVSYLDLYLVVELVYFP